jgi:serine/threonine protein kinase
VNNAATESDGTSNPSILKCIARFEIEEILGRGSMGVVYRAIDPLIERTVAIKTVSLDLPEDERSPFEDRFLREAKSAGRLSHPNIVTIYDVGETSKLAYIAMEFLQGESLKDILDRHVSLPLPLALDTAIQITDGLAFANEHGVVHRDVKPANVIVLKDSGAIKLTDFGIAHLSATNETQAGVLLGSPRYMAPEQITGGPIDGRTDVYSTGVVLYEMLTGQPPFSASDLHRLLYRIVNELPKPASSLRQEIPQELDKLLARCLAKRPEDRPQSARELGLELRKLATSISAQIRSHRDEHLPKRLTAVAFSIPVMVFLILSVGMIVIEHFVPANPPDESAHVMPATDGTVGNESLPTMTGKVLRPEREKERNNTQPSPTPDYFLQNLDKKLAELKVKRSEMLSTYTELHPDVILLDKKIEELENQRQEHLRQIKSEKHN